MHLRRSGPRKMPSVAPSGAARRDKLRLPAAVEIMGQVWTVEVQPTWSDSGVVGECDVKNRRIRIDGTLPPDTAAEVFHHELLHAMIAASGASYGMETDAEERIVYALAPVLLDTFKRNRFRFQ